MLDVSRRTAVLGLSSFGLLATRNPTAASSPRSADTAQPTAAAWMDQWMASKKAVSGPLIVARFADPIYVLQQPISWTPDQGQSGQYPGVTAPKGFVTDLASIPQVFWSELRPDGLYAYAAILHDFLYWTQSTTKNVADDILRLCMQEFGVSKSAVLAIYEGVHLFGQSSWDANATMRQSGEKRILTSIPENPKITWADWKQDPEHFR